MTTACSEDASKEWMVIGSLVVVELDSGHWQINTFAATDAHHTPRAERSTRKFDKSRPIV